MESKRRSKDGQRGQMWEMIEGTKREQGEQKGKRGAEKRTRGAIMEERNGRRMETWEVQGNRVYVPLVPLPPVFQFSFSSCISAGHTCV